MRTWLEWFVTACLYGVLLVPFMFQQALMHPLVMAKTVFFQSVILIAFAAYAALAAFHKEYQLRVTRIFSAVWLLFVAIAVSAVFAVNPVRSIWSDPARMAGIVLMAHLVLYFTMLVGMNGFFSWRRYLSVSIAVSFITALFPIIQLVFPAIFFDKLGDRLSGTIGNPIFLAAYLLIHVFLAAWFAERAYAEQRRFWPYAFVGIFDLVVVVLTQTRSAALAILVSLAVFSAYTAFKGSRRARMGIGAAWACAVVLAGGFWMTRTYSVWQSVPMLSRVARDGFSAGNRLMAWKAGLAAFTERPITGYGWDNFYIAFNTHYDPRLLRTGFSETFFDRPHNVFVQFLTETGIIGFAAYIILFTLVIWRVRREKWLVALFAAYLTQNFFAFDSLSSYLAVFFLFALADTFPHAGRHVFAGRQGSTSAEILVFAAFFVVACAGVYFFSYRSYAASRLEWKSVNQFVQGAMPEGLDYMRQALAAPTPYHDYIAKDLYPNIALFYKQDLPLPDVRSLVADVVRGMTEASESQSLDYSFWIGLADMAQSLVALDADYFETGFIALSRAEALSPRRQATEYVRAKLLNLKGDKSGALRAMADAVALDPEVGDAHFYYALLLLEEGDKVAGIRELARAAELGRDPRNAAEASVAAGHLGDLGAYKESISFFQKALLMKPSDLELTMKLGLVYYFNGEKDAARRLIEWVMKKEDVSHSPQYQFLRPIFRDLGLEK